MRKSRKSESEGYDIEELKTQHAETRAEIQSIVKFIEKCNLRFLEARGNDFVNCLIQLGMQKEAGDLQNSIGNALSSNYQYEKFLSLSEDSKEEEINKIAKKLKY